MTTFDLSTPELRATGQAVVLCRARTGPMLVFAADQVIGRSLIENGHFGEHKIDEVLGFLAARHGFVAGTFIDIGANIGTHLVHALLPGRFGCGIGVEADPDNFLLLQANVAVRGLTPRCGLVEVALSSEAGEAEMELCPSNFGDHRIRVRGVASLPDLGESARAVRNVTRDTADRVLATVRDWSQALTWIDTQGHEGQILAGAAATLCAQAPAVVLEFWPYGLERAGGRAPYFEFLDGCIEVYDINRTDWPSQGRVTLQELRETYAAMLADTRAGHYPHTDLLCLRAPLFMAQKSLPLLPIANAAMTPLERSLMTISCRDSDVIPKVPGAGSVTLRGADRVQVMHNGVEVVYGGYHGDWMAHVIRSLRGHHEPQEELLFHHLLRYVRHRTLMVELGAFWAYYTQWFLREIPDSRAWCVEPDEHNLSVGQRNAALNGTTDRVRFHRAWLGGQALDAHAAPSESSSSPVTLPMLDATQVLAMVGEPIELLHMDMQGAEIGFLRSLHPAAARAQLRFVMVSTHHSSISGSATCHVDCVEALRARGATILVEHDVIESFSGDGLIVASFQPEDIGLHFPEISRNRAETSLFKTA